MLERLLEEHRTDKVVDVVVGRGVLGEVRVPARLGDGATDPAGGARAVLLDHLQVKYNTIQNNIFYFQNRTKITCNNNLYPKLG